MAVSENENGNDGGGLTGLGRLCRCCQPERGFPAGEQMIRGSIIFQTMMWSYGSRGGSIIKRGPCMRADDHHMNENRIKEVKLFAVLCTMNDCPIV